jgi:hypothetical protein
MAAKPQFPSVPATLGTHISAVRPSARAFARCSQTSWPRRSASEQMPLSYGQAQITPDERANPVSTLRRTPATWPGPATREFPSVLYNTNNAEEFARVACWRRGQGVGCVNPLSPRTGDRREQERAAAVDLRACDRHSTAAAPGGSRTGKWTGTKGGHDAAEHQSHPPIDVF